MRSVASATAGPLRGGSGDPSPPPRRRTATTIAISASAAAAAGSRRVTSLRLAQRAQPADRAEVRGPVRADRQAGVVVVAADSGRGRDLEHPLAGAGAEADPRP